MFTLYLTELEYAPLKLGFEALEVKPSQVNLPPLKTLSNPLSVQLLPCILPHENIDHPDIPGYEKHFFIAMTQTRDPKELRALHLKLLQIYYIYLEKDQQTCSIDEIASRIWSYGLNPLLQYFTKHLLKSSTNDLPKVAPTGTRANPVEVFRDIMATAHGFVLEASRIILSAIEKAHEEKSMASVISVLARLFQYGHALTKDEEFRTCSLQWYRRYLMHYPRDGRVFYEQGIAFEPDTLNVLVCFSKVDSTEHSWEAKNLLSRLYDLDRKEKVTTMEHFMARALIRLLHDLRGQRKHGAAWVQNFVGAAIDHPETFIQRSKEFAIIVGYLLSLYPEHTWPLIELFDRLVGNTKVCALFLILVMLHSIEDPKEISHQVFSCLPQDAQERHCGLLLQLNGRLYLSCDNLPYLQLQDGNYYELC